MYRNVWLLIDLILVQLLPKICFADAIEPLVNIFYPVTFLETVITTIIIILVEAIMLRNWIKSVSFKVNLWRSTIVNISSSVAGSLIMFSHRVNNQIPGMPLYEYDRKNFTSFALIMFLITIAVETPILIFLYRKEVKSKWKMIFVSVGINVTSYLTVLVIEVGLPLLLLSLHLLKD